MDNLASADSSGVTTRPWPRRVVNFAEAEARHGARAGEILSWLWHEDPLADDVVALFVREPQHRATYERMLVGGAAGATSGAGKVPEALDRFFSHLTDIPSWVDFDRIDRAGRVLFRSGMPGGIVLGAKSLCLGYCSPGGNKPLVMTGRLEGDKIGMRLAETSRFVVATCQAGGLRAFAPGFVINVRVRIIHAHVRHMIRKHGKWNEAAWGAPINQHDMLGTALLFSQSFIEGIRQFGFRVTPEEGADYLHLWRYGSHLMGLDPSLFPHSEEEALAQADIISTTQGEPDDDSRMLVDALVRSVEHNARSDKQKREAEVRVNVGYGFVRSLLGAELSDGLSLPYDRYRFVLPTVRGMVSLIEPLRQRVPRLDAAMTRAGTRYWDEVIRIGLAGKKPKFTAPAKLLRPQPAG